MLQLTHLLFIFLFGNCLCFQDDYYWREYTDGEVPVDAIVGGQNSEGINIYIGQAYIKDRGIIVTEIFAGIQEVYVPMSGEAVKTAEVIKILCGPEQNLYWASTNSTSVHSLLVNRDAVIGGHEYGKKDSDAHGILHIGKNKAQNKIGKIPIFEKDPQFYFSDNLKESTATTFEILLYKKN
ncbi:uncharacterized protein LOC123015484 [Tribolium madens]|uniref:uncharacterized protein LOC123015484 n=1 Tax=Tribolium madens TaxID=41895 RepID=UPI001CF75296|nr:uncharacterized protein LOC123015484 [Tribolium madens]